MTIAILSFIAIIVVLILAHELGHFITAKASGVTVDEFGLGFPPRLLSVKRGGTVYSLNAILLGGFVKMAGEEDPNVPGSLASRSTGIRVLVLSAGSVMNLLLPLLLFSIAFMIPHYQITGEVTIIEIETDSPAQAAGLAAGDIILSLNNNAVNNTSDLDRYIHTNLGKEAIMIVRHSNGTEDSLTVVPRWKPPEGGGAIGLLASTFNPITERRSEPFWRALPMGVGTCIETFILFKNEIISIIIGASPVVISGPVGIAQVTTEVAKAGLSPLLEFAAFLSINLGIVNLFPLPALDGGRIAFVLLEWVRRGKRISPKREGIIHAIGFALLMAAFAAITYQDIARIISGDSLLP